MLDQDKTKEQLISELFELRQRISTDTFLKERENQFLNLAESATDAIVLVNDAGNIVFWNSAACTIFGYDKDDAINMPLKNIVGAPETHAQAFERFQLNDCSSLIKNVFESKGIRKNGQLFPVELSVSFYKTTEGGLYGAIIRDISQRKHTEELLRRSEQQYRSVVETSSDAIITADMQNNIVSWNKGAERIFGYTADEILNKSVFTLVPERLHAAHAMRIADLSSSKLNTPILAQYPSWGLRKDGTEFLAEASASKWETNDGIFMTITLRDVTDRVQTELTLRTSEERFRSLIETASDAIICTDLQGTIIMWNKGAEELYGYSADEMINKSFSDLLPSHFSIDTQNNMFDYFAQHANGIIYTNASITVQRKDGHEFQAEGSVSKWESSEGIFLTAIVRNITERKKAEEALLRSEEQYRSVVETAFDAIITVDSHGIIMSWNKAAELILGYSADEIINKSFLTLIPERFHASQFQKLQEFDNAPDILRRGELPVKRKDGTEIFAESSLSKWETKDGIYFTTFIKDITERKKAENIISQVNTCLLSLTADPDTNIHYLVESAGKILGGDCSAYHGIRGSNVCIKAEWNVLAANKKLYPLKADMLLQLLNQYGIEPFVLENPEKLHHLSSESLSFHLPYQTLLAILVRRNNLVSGSLHVAFNLPQTFTPTQLNGFSIIAKAIEVEEKRKKELSQLKKSQIKLTKSEKSLKNFSAKILSIREEEKKNISSALHDEIGSMVVALSALLTLAKEEIVENNNEQAIKNIIQTESVLKQSIEKLKTIVHDLRPPDLDIIGFTASLKNHLLFLSTQSKIAIDFSTTVNDRLIRGETAIILYRVCQEAVNNALSHAHPLKISVQLTSSKGSINLAIQDDGCGFDYKKQSKFHQKSVQLGLISMRERVAALGGKFTIESVINKGTSVFISIPQ